MNKSIALLSLALLASAPASADRVLGVYAGANSWNQNYDGFVRDLDTSGTSREIDLEDDLGFDDENGNVLYIAVEHFVPFVPNVMLKYTDVQTDADGTIAISTGFGDETLSGDVESDIDLSHTDLTLYWQLLDNWVSLDLGLTVRLFDGSVKIEETSGTMNSAEEDFEAPIPLIYGKARFDLPLSGMYASVSGNILGDGDNNFLDYQATVGYESKFRLGVEAGYRSMELDLDDVDDIEADITIDGAFVGLFFHL